MLSPSSFKHGQSSLCLNVAEVPRRSSGQVRAICPVQQSLPGLPFKWGPDNGAGPSWLGWDRATMAGLHIYPLKYYIA
jgi:hypothetical protein